MPFTGKNPDPNYVELAIDPEMDTLEVDADGDSLAFEAGLVIVGQTASETL